jgi:hypothetical protein
VRSTSADRRAHRIHHEHRPLTLSNFPVGALSKGADTNSRCRSCGFARLWHDPTPNIRILSPRYCKSQSYSRRVHRRDRDPQPHPLRSNPHSSSQLLNPSARSRGFLPWGLSDACPQTSPGMACSLTKGRNRTTLNNSRHSTAQIACMKAAIRRR